MVGERLIPATTCTVRQRGPIDRTPSMPTTSTMSTAERSLALVTTKGAGPPSSTDQVVVTLLQRVAVARVARLTSMRNSIVAHHQPIGMAAATVQSTTKAGLGVGSSA